MAEEAEGMSARQRAWVVAGIVTAGGAQRPWGLCSPPLGRALHHQSGTRRGATADARTCEDICTSLSRHRDRHADLDISTNRSSTGAKSICVHSKPPTSRWPSAPDNSLSNAPIRRAHPSATVATCGDARSSTPSPPNRRPAGQPPTPEQQGRPTRRLRQGVLRAQRRSRADDQYVEVLPGDGREVRQESLRLPRNRARRSNSPVARLVDPPMGLRVLHVTARVRWPQSRSSTQTSRVRRPPRRTPRGGACPGSVPRATSRRCPAALCP